MIKSRSLTISADAGKFAPGFFFELPRLKTCRDAGRRTGYRLSFGGFGYWLCLWVHYV